MAITTHFDSDDTPNPVAGASSCTAQPQAVSSSWKSVVARVCEWQAQARLIPTQTTIVFPFVQLIAPARQAWVQQQGTGFLPRLETTQTWLTRLGGIHQPGSGPTGDLILDHLQARTWLRKLSQEQAQALSDVLVDPLVAIANELVQAAAAVAPQNRSIYWQQAEEIAAQFQPGVAGVEAALGPLAVAWAKATEAFNTDVLFSAAKQAHKETAPAGLVVIQAGGADTLTRNLFAQWPETKRLWLDLDYLDAIPSSPHQPDKENTAPGDAAPLGDPVSQTAHANPPVWQVASGAEDEAERAAAHVIHLLNQGIMPVALCSQDRPIARRVWALLNRQQIPMADETGWTLSTTRSAALAMSLVKSAIAQAPSDAVLDAFKALPPSSPYLQGLDELEVCLRKTSTSVWPAEPSASQMQYWPQCAKNMLGRINELLNALRGDIHIKRSLWSHLHALERSLKTCGGWSALLCDEAGREVIQTLHLHELQMSHGQTDDACVPQTNVSATPFAQYAQSINMGYVDFSHWVSHALETVTFIPPAPDKPQVVLTPLARLMLRPFAAVVIPGCDDSRLTAQPSFPGFWREAQRAQLGLMNRELWWQRLQAQWVQALRLPNVTLLWRVAEGSQPLGPASLVLRAIGQVHEAGAAHSGALPALTPHGITEHDARIVKKFSPQQTKIPEPRPAQRLPVHQLSASAYKALRECPYRFYAMYMLQLRELDEFDRSLDRRDYGNWLHAVLRQFHAIRASKLSLPTQQADEQLLESCAQEHAQALDEASIIPWQARWPALKAAYLRWLYQYERESGEFVRAEFNMHYALAENIVLHGRIDRLDHQHGLPVLVDYKTERRIYTELRVKDPYEDVQLPFYALLAQGELIEKGCPAGSIANSGQARAIYLSLDDRENMAKAIEQDQLQEVKNALAKAITDDITRLKNGFPAYPLGQEPSCSYCDAKGLCRKAYWAQAFSPSEKTITQNITEK